MLADTQLKKENETNSPEEKEFNLKWIEIYKQIYKQVYF